MPTLTHRGVPLYYEVHGQGPTVLVMVGWGTYTDGAFAQVPWAVAEGRRVVLIDWRGLGQSGDNDDIPATTRARQLTSSASLASVPALPNGWPLIIPNLCDH
ncbi:MAG: alpha/beta hydrolase [Actinobacteria bacterium]|nr:alpha/beta hydrolase [Actinomycetota bacterium]